MNRAKAYVIRHIVSQAGAPLTDDRVELAYTELLSLLDEARKLGRREAAEARAALVDAS